LRWNQSSSRNRPRDPPIWGQSEELINRPALSRR